MGNLQNDFFECKVLNSGSKMRSKYPLNLSDKTNHLSFSSRLFKKYFWGFWSKNRSLRTAYYTLLVLVNKHERACLLWLHNKKTGW